MSDCGLPANVGSMEGLGALPEQAGWALEMHGQCVLFANNTEKARGLSPGATTRIYTEAQMLTAVTDAHNNWDVLVASQDAEIERLREHAVILAGTAEAVERERCATVCERISQQYKDAPGAHALERAANAIRIDA